ncbi:MAG: nitrate- and nitrite sensing domain-containing protein [Deltaproteobacteria bacterium]|nr:nitrate- and nitrite sensing domain-containing protein [Deltaproteobacteria bacterium]
MSNIAKIGIKGKLILMQVLPVLVALYFSVTVVLEQSNTVKEIEGLQTLSTLAVDLSALVHEQQKERGASALYLGSNGKLFSNELKRQKNVTDEKIKTLLNFLTDFNQDKFGEEFKKTVSKSTMLLQKLEIIRDRTMALSISAPEAIKFYTLINNEMLGTIGFISKLSKNVEMTQATSAYVNFLLGKERAGLERAVLSNTFARDNFADGMHQTFITLFTEQNTYADVFKATATKAQINFYNKTVQGRAVDEVERMRKVALNKAALGNFGIKASYWFSTITEKIELLKNVEDKLSVDLNLLGDSLKSSARSTLLVSIVIAVLAITGALILTFFIGRTISNPIFQVITRLKNGALNISSASDQLASAGHKLSEGASEQASTLEETSASLEEISSMVKQNADNSAQASNLAVSARDTAEKGEGSVTNMVTAMEDINKSSEEVSQIIKVINEIAFQTNLLALNAAVEAARAGEHGKGFAVVAEEVRSLAKRSAEAAKETGGLIENSINKAKDGTKLATEAGVVLNEIVTHNRQVETLISDITTASNEQSEGLVQVSKALNQMEQIVQGVSASSEENAASSTELVTQSRGLEDVIQSLSTIVDGNNTNSEADANYDKKKKQPQG